MVKQHDQIRKTATGQGDDYTTGCLLDYQYLKDYYNLIAVDLSKQKELSADSRAIQQIEFYGILKTNSQVCIVWEKSKETVLQLSKGKASVVTTYKWLNAVNVKSTDAQLKKLKTAVKKIKQEQL